MNIEINKTTVGNVLKSIDGSLRSGAGEGAGQDVCVMQAIRRAFDLDAGPDSFDECVGNFVRSFAVALNDQEWSSAAARAEGMKSLAVAGVGSNTLDQVEFAKRLSLKTIQKLLPKMFRDVAPVCDKDGNHEFLKHADKCEAAADLDAAYAAAAAAAAAFAAFAAAFAAARAAARAAADRDSWFRLVAALAVEVLVEMKSPGTKFLGLCDSAK